MRLIPAFLVLIALVAVPVAAEEIVDFKNGRSMPVVSHEIKDGMVHVDLGDNAFFAFPESTIESIVVAGKNVMIQASYQKGTNRRVPTTEGSYPVQGRDRPRQRELIVEENTQPSPIEIDEKTGMAVYKPMGRSKASNRRSIGVTGNMRVLSDNPVDSGRGDGKLTYGATTPMGNRHVIGGLDPRRGNAPRRPDMPKPVSVSLKGPSNGGPSPTDAPPEPEPSGDSDSNN